MTDIEKAFRLTWLREDIEHIKTKIVLLQVVSDSDEDRLQSAIWHLRRSQDILKSIPSGTTEDSLTRILEISIDDVRAKRQCEKIGGGE